MPACSGAFRAVDIFDGFFADVGLRTLTSQPGAMSGREYLNLKPRFSLKKPHGLLKKGVPQQEPPENRTKQTRKLHSEFKHPVSKPISKMLQNLPHQAP